MRLAEILYGENSFACEFAGNYLFKLWHIPGYDKTLITRRYSRLITKMYITVSFKGDDNDPETQAVVEGSDRTVANMENVCKKLRLNDFKWLKVRFINSYTGGLVQAAIMGGGRFLGRPYTGENCLLPLLKLRATRVSACFLPLLCRPDVASLNSFKSIITRLQASRLA